ncbi:unnamed protein product, partial [Notodromas monacha]
MHFFFQRVAVGQSQSRIPPRFGSEEIKPALVFSDPVDVHPASLLPASGKSESDTKPHRYLEPDINAGTPSPLKDPLPLEDTRNTPSKETPSPLTGTHDYVEGLTQSATNNREVGSFRSATSFSTSEKVRDSDRYGVTTSSKSDDSSRDSAGRWSSFRHPTQSSSNSYNDPVAVGQSQSRIPPRFGSEEIKPALVFSDPVDVHPASLLPASGKSESDTKPHRYLEPDINAGTPSPLKDPLPLEDTRNTPSKETPSPLTGTHDYVEGLTQSATNNREVGSFRSATSFSTSEKVRDSDRYGVTTSSKSDDSSRDSAGRWSSFRHPTQSSSNSYND